MIHRFIEKGQTFVHDKLKPNFQTLELDEPFQKKHKSKVHFADEESSRAIFPSDDESIEQLEANLPHAERMYLQGCYNVPLQNDMEMSSIKHAVRSKIPVIITKPKRSHYGIIQQPLEEMEEPVANECKPIAMEVLPR